MALSAYDGLIANSSPVLLLIPWLILPDFVRSYRGSYVFQCVDE